jgi:glycosyltransferase involved in cell wall biosynthesis
MRIGILWHVVYPWDIRMEKIIKVLLNDGHEVHLVCKGKEGLAAFEDHGRLRISRVVPLLGWRAPNRFLGAPLPFNPFWYWRALRVFREARIERLLVRDLPLAGLAGRLGKRLGIPVFFDMAENYPAALVAYNKAVYKPFLFGNGWLPKQYEKFSLRSMHRVFVVAEEQAERLARIGFDRARISVVMNTPDVDYYQDCVRQNAASAPADSALNLLYIGKVDAHRGVDLLLSAMPDIGRRHPAARMIIVGDGTQRQRLERYARELGICDKVVFAGWLPFDRVPAYVAASTLCLIPHLKSEHTETTVPNKIFDYMAFGKPVVASDCAPLARIIRETACGRVFRSGDAGDLAAQVIGLLDDPQRATLGDNGRRAVAARYHWGRDAAVLLAGLKVD